MPALLRLSAGALLLLAWVLVSPGAATAAPHIDLTASRCVAFTTTADPPPASTCQELRSDYSNGWMWIAADVPPRFGQDTAVSVQLSRFDGLAVLFHYADGSFTRQDVHNGDYGNHWRLGGTIAFTAPQRSVPVTAVTLGIDRPSWARQLSARLGTNDHDVAYDGSQLVIAASLALLLLSIAATSFLSSVSGQWSLMWNAVWNAMVIGWALAWTQGLLILAPGLAGDASARLATFFSMMAVAGACLQVADIARQQISPMLRQAIIIDSVCVAVIGIIAAITPGHWLPLVSNVVDIAVLLSALLFVIIAVIGVRGGNQELRDFILGFSIPVMAVVWTIFIDGGITPGDRSGRYLVLVCCAMQTVWLAIAGAFRLSLAQRERDMARMREARMTEIAERDALTGLLNRRGFVDSFNRAVVESGRAKLILLDLDRFKRINDSHGHDSGDHVLQAVAAQLQLTAGKQPVGRLGGEEFGVIVPNHAEAAVFAEQLRAAIAALRVRLDNDGTVVQVTISAGIGIALAPDDFAIAYHAADQTLLATKGHSRIRTGRPRKATDAPASPAP